MNLDADRRFGGAWLAFALALACHVIDEAAHDFLSVYNPNALWLRARFHLPFPPTFTFRQWIVGLSLAIALLLALTPFARRRARWLRVPAVLLGLVVGVANGLAHLLSSFYFRKLMPGVLTAPFIIAAGILLISAARNKKGSALGRASGSQ